MMLSETRPENSVLRNEISLYTGPLTAEVVLREIVRAKAAFPSLPTVFFDVLRDRINANSFTNERFKDAVNYVIDNCRYPTPTIADFVSYDKRIKFSTYDEMLKKASDLGPEIWRSYKPVILPGREKAVWMHVDDMKEAGLEEYTPKPPKP